MRKFKIGDRGRINDLTSYYHGYHGYITELGDSETHPRINYVVKTNSPSSDLNGTTSWVCFKLVLNEVFIESDIQWYREQRLKQILDEV